MATLYLVDGFANPISSAGITDVRQGTTAPLAGNFIVKVPDYLSVQNPTDATDLVLKKHQALLAYYAGTTNVAYDDLFDLTSVDLAAAQVGGVFGDRNIVSVYSGARFQSTAVTLALAPAQAYITWETFIVTLDDPSEGRAVPAYSEMSMGFTCEVSFDNGAHFYTTTDGALLNIPVVGQGTDFIIRLTYTVPLSPPIPLRVGSWAVIY